MKEYIEREATNVCENPPISQAIKGGEKSICWSCFHWEVCFAKKNQPCIKCSRFIPAADVREVVRAKWIAHYNDGKFRGHCVCSACGRTVLTDPDIARFYSFCPNCGAEMRGEEDGN